MPPVVSEAPGRYELHIKYHIDIYGTARNCNGDISPEARSLWTQNT